MSDNLTPTEVAHDIAITALYQRYVNLPSKTTRDKKVRNAVAKLHNKLLISSKMDGVCLDENL